MNSKYYKQYDTWNTKCIHVKEGDISYFGNPMNGQHRNSRKWHFGDTWPGHRCGAKTRKGTSCQKAALKGRKRCRLHGGKAGAPRGELHGNFKYGRYTIEAMDRHRSAQERLKELIALAKFADLFD
jgi:hypothetical protein